MGDGNPVGYFPTAFLDSEQRLAASKVIKRFILHAKKTAFVVEHDFIMATYLADRVIVYEGTPSISAKANTYVHASLCCAQLCCEGIFVVRCIRQGDAESVCSDNCSILIPFNFASKIEKKQNIF